MAAASPAARRLGTACLLAAGAGTLLLIVAGRQSGQSWLPSYLFVWLFVLGLSLGSLAWVVVHNLTGGDWGDAARPFLQAALRLFPLTALLALPLLFAPAQLLPWMHTTAGAPEAGFVAGQRWYLNSTFFYARAILYFAIWLGLARLLRSDRALAPHLPARREPSLQAVSAVGFVLYALTTTFAAVDWTMSLTPRWHSTEFGLLIGTGQALSALAGAIVCANALAAEVDAPLRQRFHDLGNLALALVLVRDKKIENAIRYSRALEKFFAPEEAKGLKVLGPAQAPLARLRRDYRFQFLLKAPRRSQLTATLSACLDFCAKKEIPEGAVLVDIDPVNLL